jgi:hypothetical protein
MQWWTLPDTYVAFVLGMLTIQMSICNPTTRILRKNECFKDMSENSELPRIPEKEITSFEAFLESPQEIFYLNDSSLEDMFEKGDNPSKKLQFQSTKIRKKRFCSS